MIVYQKHGLNVDIPTPKIDFSLSFDVPIFNTNENKP